MREKSIGNCGFSSWLTFITIKVYSDVIASRRSGLAMLSMIAALLMIALMVFLAIRIFAVRQGTETSGRGSPIERARNVQCLAQIEKIEMQVQLYGVRLGRHPETLEVLEGLGPDDLRCPVTRSPYQYDPQSGRIFCPDHVK